MGFIIQSSQPAVKVRQEKSVMTSFDRGPFLVSLFSFAFSFSQHQGLLQWVNFSHQVAKVLELQIQYFKEAECKMKDERLCRGPDIFHPF